MSPVVGVLVLIVLTVLLVTIVAVGASTLTLESGGPTAAFDLTADSGTSEITIEHVAGDRIDVEELSVTVAVNDDPLAAQPPVPFVGATGFDGAPRGAFNAEADPEWRVGEQVGFTVAETNDPGIDAGDSVTVTLAVDGYRVAALETTAR
ncbi:type IV pilin [Natronorubrum sp. JWXQ-INN-674]|uniref:Type IV pilin n=1 Tax=Natronorubrum halalkaliphilum TaxID=2691917 RepID=A0A6B0VIG3_9EURY|nr:type IV pilin [Natronorubrum halalkaliphilum]MXV61358.1 type IV pilin [Natronorubrum halalkaliphilum]